MTPAIASALLPLLSLLDAELAHNISLAALRLGLAGHDAEPDDPALAVTAMGMTFSNPIGLAAGFDKDAVALRPLARLGFGFIEAGTVTPRPQQGTPPPRLFRLAADRAVINRMGFNNAGLAVFLNNFRKSPRGGVPVGANVGINKDAADPERDYPAMIRAVAPYADYVVINVSSPNTPGLRDLQNEARLQAILSRVQCPVPLLVKVAPDLSADGIAMVVETCVTNGVRGLIVGNTTISRPPGLRSQHSTQPGGLSGKPLFELSNRALLHAARAARGRLVLIGVGGVACGQDVLAKIRAGASLVQLYTGLVYGGPALLGRIKHELVVALKEQEFSSVAAAVGADM